MKRKFIIKGAALFLVLSFTVGSMVTGCAKKEIAFTTGLSNDDLFKIDGTICSMDEMNIVLLNLQREYAGLFGVGNWEQKFAKDTVGSYVKEQAVKQMSQIKALAALAAKEGITLSKEEIDSVKNATAQYLESIDDSVEGKLKIDSSSVENVYKQYCLANKFYQNEISKVNTEISDDEARIISIQYIFMSTVKTDENGSSVPISEDERNELNNKVAAIKERINSGEEFSNIAYDYTENESIDMDLGRGKMSQAFEDAAFNLTDGQVSEAVEDDKGIYIIKCISNYNEAATLDNKYKIYESRCNEAINEVYNNYIDNVLTQFNNEQWEKVSLSSDKSVLSLPDLFEIYNANFPKEQNVSMQ